MTKLLLLILLALLALAKSDTRGNAIHVKNEDPNKVLYVQCLQDSEIGCRYDKGTDRNPYEPQELKYLDWSSMYSSGGRRPNLDSRMEVQVSPCPDFTKFSVTFLVHNDHGGSGDHTPAFQLFGEWNGTEILLQHSWYTMDAGDKEAHYALPGVNGTALRVQRKTSSYYYIEWWLHATSSVPSCANA